MKNKVWHLMMDRNLLTRSQLGCGARLSRTVRFFSGRKELDRVLGRIGQHGKTGFAASSHVEAPDRYYKYELALSKQALEIRGCELDFEIEVYSDMGLHLLYFLEKALRHDPDFIGIMRSSKVIKGSVAKPLAASSSEELRTKRRSLFTLIRKFQALFSPESEDDFFGLYGLFGYDLVFQFEEVLRKANCPTEENSLQLFLPEILLVHEPITGMTAELSYALESDDADETDLFFDPTQGHANNTDPSETLVIQNKKPPEISYQAYVEAAQKYFYAGELFEVVPSYDMALRHDEKTAPYQVYKELTHMNPSPYCFMIGAGNRHIIGASPEMFVRVHKGEVETCPISGTLPRGQTALEDEAQIRRLLGSLKDTCELTMCTDVDRNDKSRICKPGTIQVKKRRMIEIYAHLIHTVDWVTGVLRPGFDSLDAFISHMWAVTVTGAPKPAALQWIEDHEASRRGWYGGAAGYIGFGDSLDTGLVIRTLEISPKGAHTRVGATLLHYSNAEEEAEETRVKAAAMVKTLDNIGIFTQGGLPEDNRHRAVTLSGPRVLVVDHRDSFVHTLADYFRQCGAQVTTLRSTEARTALLEEGGAAYQLVVLSPGPGTPEDFDTDATIRLCLERQLPIFGVCLGLQALITYFGGELSRLSMPFHGQPSTIRVCNKSRLFDGLPESALVGRYHSLHAATVPKCLRVTALDTEGTIMAVEHKELCLSAVQFHPESIMTHPSLGLGMIRNVLKGVSR